MNRRNWLRTSVATGLALSATAKGNFAEAKPIAPRSVSRWPLGVLNRAWAGWELDDAIKGAKEAGFTGFGLISPQKGKHLIGSDVSAESVDAVKRQIEDRGLDVIVAALRYREDDPLPALRDEVRRQIENASRLGVGFLMTFGVDRAANFAKFEQVMTDAAARTATTGIRLVIKPHGGISAGPTEILRCIERVGHPNFSVWYDPGNIVHYTGADPVEAVVPIAKRVTGLCVKDCAKRGGEVMISLGEGRVNFPALLARMAEAGFNGPLLLEGIRIGATPEETTANAKANLVVLERAIKTLPPR